MPKKSSPVVKKQFRGFAVMSKAKRLSICCLGGEATVKKYGGAHMSRIGKRGRRQRTLNEQKAKAKAA